MHALLDELNAMPAPEQHPVEAREDLSAVHELADHFRRQLEESRDREIRLLGQIEVLTGQLARADAEIERMRQAAMRHDQ
jgi:hypothetical protein